MLPGLLLTIQSFLFSRVHSGWTRVIKGGVWPSTPLWNDCARVYPAVSTKFGKYPFLGWFYPFLARCGLVCPGLAQKHRRLATVPARGCCGTTKRRPPTSKRPSAQTRSNVVSIRDQHTTGLGSLISAYIYDESRSWVLTPISCSSREAPSTPDNADTDNEDSYCYSTYKSWCSCGLPINGTTNEASFTTTRQLPPVWSRERLNSRSEPVSLAKSIASYIILTSSFNMVVHYPNRLLAPCPWIRIYRHTQYQTSHNSSVSNNTKQYYVRAAFSFIMQVRALGA